MTNWRTTLLGLLGAIWIVAEPIMTNGDFEIERDWKKVVTAAGLAVFSYVVKDAKTSGTTKL